MKKFTLWPVSVVVFAFLLSLVLVSGCSAVEDVFGGDEDPTQSLSLYQDKTEASPFEQVTITAIDYSFPQETYVAAIGGKEVTLTRIASNQLVFTMPFVAGAQVLDLVVDEVTYSFDFLVNELEPIANPDELINTYKQNVEGIINEVEQMIQQGELQIPAEHMQVLQNQQLAFEQSFASATSDQKQEVAQFIKANPGFFNFEHIQLQQFNDSLNTSRAFVAWDQQLTDDMRYFTGLVIATGATIGIFNGTLYSGNPFLIGAATLALATEFVLVFNQTETMLTRSYKPFEFDLNNELRNTIVEFENDIPYQLGIDATYRTLYKNDQQSSNVTIELVANINTFTGYWNQVSSLVPGLNGSVENLDDKNGYVTNANRLAVTPEYISIDNISNSNVTMSNFSHAGTVKVTFSTNADADQDFTFDIVYTNPDFSEERITVSARILVPVFDFTGTWLLSYYTADMSTGVEYLHQQERFTCNASGYAASSQIRYPNNPPPNNDWRPAGEIGLSYENGQIVINESVGFYVQVVSFDDLVFYSANWNTNYNVGDYYWKIKLEK
ncbi:MAG: hypothetical protein K9G61_03015 [Bacteroidales bacterium]|nr:hypothetical protein [Bacteroidales bacterium]